MNLGVPLNSSDGKFSSPCFGSVLSGQQDPGLAEAPGGPGRRVQHHRGSQASSSDGAQGGGGATERAKPRPSVRRCRPSLSDLWLFVLQIQSEVCSRRVLISNLPKMDVEILLNKLELHFSKRRNGGGEVEACDILPDSWTVVLTFADEGGEC